MGESRALVEFGGTLRRLRLASNLSQEQLADAANLDRTYLSDIERGKRNLGLNNIHALARALSVEVADLFPRVPEERLVASYLVDPSFRVDCGFLVTAVDIERSILRANQVLAALPMSLYQTVDFKAQSGMVGAVFAAELATEVGAIPNPIEKGHPDVVPPAAATATEAELRNYPTGLEVKSTVGSIRQGVQLAPGVARARVLVGVTWQAHHRDVRQLMGMAWDYVGGTPDQPASPTVTGVFYSGQLMEQDWGAISGTTGRNTKVTGMMTSGRAKMAAGAVAVIDDDAYLEAFSSRIGLLPAAFQR